MVIGAFLRLTRQNHLCSIVSVVGSVTGGLVPVQTPRQQIPAGGVPIGEVLPLTLNRFVLSDYLDSVF